MHLFNNNLLSSWIYKLTTGSYNLVSVIFNVTFVGLLTAATAESASGSASLVALLVKTQFADHVKVKDTSQLISSISSVLQKLFKYFNGIKISTFSFSTLLPSNFL